MSGPQPQPGIMEIAPYQGGASRLEGARRVIKLGSNENPNGPCPAAVAAYRETAGALHRYPGTDHGPLRRAIAEVRGLDADRIICGVGSDEILALLCFAYAGVGCEVIHTEHGFSMYRISALAAGATPVEVGETDRRVDVESILAGVTDATRLVFVANPANPTGTMVASGDLNRLVRGLPGHVMLVLDGAYAEFAPGFDGGTSLVEAHDNVVMTRTFSKLYGLGGLRVGWGYGAPAVIDVLNRVRGPFNLGAGQLAAAEAAVRDRDFAEGYVAENARLRAWLAEALARVGVPSDTSFANFILARFADQREAEACDAHLRGQGIIVRQVAGYGLPDCLRITVGTGSDCEAVARAVAEFKDTRP